MALVDELEKTKQKLIEDAGRATLERAVGRAVTDLTLTPEQKAARDATDEAASRTRLVKVILGGVFVVVAGIVVMKLLAKLWFFGIGLVLVGGLGAAGYLVAKPQIDAFQKRRLADRAAAEEARTADDRARAAEQATAAAKQKLEDDLARLKKQV